jgi:CheY-like chemotaxis protein
MNRPTQILLIEDEVDIAAMLQVFLTANGYAFLHAADGITGMTLAQRHLPDLILMDVMLPDLDGFTICGRLRRGKHTAHIPVIFLTRYAEHANRLQALELGAADFIAKPFDPAELLLRLRNTLALAPEVHHADPPSTTITREQLNRARTDPAQAVIELSIQHSAAYARRYGPAKLQQVHDELAGLVNWALDQAEIAERLAGYVDDRYLAVVYPAQEAEAFATRIVEMFDFRVRQFYTDFDADRGHLTVDGTRQPLMRLAYRLHNDAPLGPPAIAG